MSAKEGKTMAKTRRPARDFYAMAKKDIMLAQSPTE
jgi:hypothetical protein